MNGLLPFGMAIRALRRNKVRASLTALGIIVGTASIIAVMAVGQGASNMMQDQIERMGSNLVIVFPGSVRVSGAHTGAGGQETLTAADGDAIAAECSGVVAVTPIVGSWGQMVFRNQNWHARVQGVSPNYREVRDWNLAAGSFFSDSDVRSGARVCVVGMTVVQNLFAGADPVGQWVRINNMPFWVVGVLEPKGSAVWGMDLDDMVLMPWTTVRRFIEKSTFDNVDQIFVRVASARTLKATMADMEALLRQRHHVRSAADDDFTVMDMTEMTQAFTQISRLMTVLLTVIASISLLVGGIGIMNIMLVSVTERTREIGVRVAVGARPVDIMLQFLVEALVLSCLGAAAGVLFGALAAGVISNINRWPVHVSAGSVVLAVLFAGCIGIFFGWYPAWRASRLNPIECLRYE